MAKFLTPLKAKIIRRKKSWFLGVRDYHRLLEPLCFEYHSAMCLPGDTLRIYVPSGFITDFSTIPKTFRPLIGGYPTTNRPGAMHDFLYSTRSGRCYADRLFRLALRSEGVPKWKAHAMYAAVRLFGWMPYYLAR
jgi:hypothetical protein